MTSRLLSFPSPGWVAALLICGVTCLRLVYLAFWCPLDLAPDEAHYWDWSRRLDWSYYSKGPLVAVLIRASCWLFGDLSRALNGTEMLAVRLPAVLCGALLLWALYRLDVATVVRWFALDDD
jgi:4-amino-4-deoxy-L-arabinose transferase-like glycosyltransferase